MSRKSQRAKLVLTDQQRQYLIGIAQSRTAAIREVERAQILLKYADGISISRIQSILGVSRPTIYKCIDKALAMGIEIGLKDKYHSPKVRVITDEAKAWVVNLACTKPKAHGYAAEIWSHRLLAQHTRQYAPQTGHECLNNAAKATIQRILKEHPIQPHKVRYFTENRDPEFEKKMHDILVVYQEVNVLNEQSESDQELPIITVSIDEKPGIQAIKNVGPDLPPIPGKRAFIGRDYHYERLGTLSLLAALDLHNGHVFAQVHERHRSIEFISLLKEIDEFYPKESLIRLILDNHSAHISKETMSYLATRPNRFIYVHTPTHGSWLNLVETLFGKISRTFLKNIRVNSKDELRQRILKGFEEINAAPVVHRWKNFKFAQYIL
ncbi:IS630 family transposase [candidate division KSB1 bacterium]|nr:IS630 family transposase [candidate division KSB1 bacterium]